ncbi:uncharacterized protein LOC141602016 [Silene latifolia]|uniref:uncharacterized protein LOC141602016 n=1 Tax=Silene latifolia TaxID=37657 RepID=UPI003D782D02
MVSWHGFINTCYICGYQAETMDHLFFTCAYSKEVVKIVGQWIGIMLPTQHFHEWSLRRGQSKIRIDVINVVFNACIYHVWRQRDLSKHELTLICPEKVAATIVDEMKIRIKRCSMKMANTDKIWIRGLIDDAN